jgi:hypothetical protein
VIAVPTPAIVPGQSSPYVFVIGADNAVSIRTVEIGRAVGELTVVDSGLVVGEQVVTDGQSRLKSGDKVDIKTAARPKPDDERRGDSTAGGKTTPAGAKPPAPKSGGVKTR